MKASIFKAKVEEDEDNSDKDSSKDGDMSLFARHYNKYIKRNDIKHSNKNLVKLKKKI